MTDITTGAALKHGPRQQRGVEKEPRAIITALEEIAATHNGRITAHEVVAVAANPKSPLHRYFEWDDSAAAARYRLDQARNLIANIRVRLTGTDGPLVRAFVHVPLSGADHYAPAAVAMSDAATRALILNRALSELRAVEARYRDLSELAEIWAVAARIAAQ